MGAARNGGGRQERTIERRIREARFPNQGSLEDFDWSFNAAAIDRTQIEQLATGDRVERCENLVMLGQSGVGKSRLLEGIGRRLCVLGKRVRYTTSGDLITQLTASLADGTLPRQISYWTKFDLLIVDEFGFDYVERQLDPQAGHLLFKVIAARNGKSSTALGTNMLRRRPVARHLVLLRMPSRWRSADIMDCASLCSLRVAKQVVSEFQGQVLSVGKDFATCCDQRPNDIDQTATGQR